MTSWILAIDADHPQHWDYAKRDKVWDLRTRRPIAAGDTVYFWLAKGSMLGRGIVAADVTDSPSTGLPWDDATTSAYRGRIHFRETEDYDGEALTWTELADRSGLKGTPNFAPRSDDPEVELKLAALFGGELEASVGVPLPSIDRAYEVLGVEAPEGFEEDRRERTLAVIAIRRGQSRFRDALLRAYDGRCAVTGSTTDRVLEAAHISPYLGKHTNVVSNGLLLRADIHTLFDSGLITIVWADDSSYRVRVAPSITDATYRELDGRLLSAIPHRASDRPHPEILATHNAGCAWLAADELSRTPHGPSSDSGTTPIPSERR